MTTIRRDLKKAKVPSYERREEKIGLEAVQMSLEAPIKAKTTTMKDFMIIKSQKIINTEEFHYQEDLLHIGIQISFMATVTYAIIMVITLCTVKQMTYILQ